MDDTKVITSDNKNIVNIFKDKAEHAKASRESGIINCNTGSSLRMDSEGNTTVAASKTVQYKLQYSEGKATEISLESNTITNRKNIETDEIVINKHKLNSQLYELTDMKEFLGDNTKAIGNFTVYGTVLVKAWEPYLKKWVLIRRKIRTPLFSNQLNITYCPNDMKIDDNITNEINEMRNSDNLSFTSEFQGKKDK